MSRTYRNNPEDRWYRRPRTQNERQANAFLEAEERYGDDLPLQVSKANRRNRWIPSAWDDQRISATAE